MIRRIITVSKPKIIDVKNMSRARNKDGTRRNVGRVQNTASLKPKRKCGECGENTHTYTKKTCLLNQKAKAKVVTQPMNNDDVN
ncbi:hypothetical protein CTI12_AA261080 [Artemisia annua]|uniref:Zinc finger, SWIM-type n=1 Tax=Artemisia annua TaxID=35608 RepID=A0A2U1MZF0_ARTAN|nr:hypothetical protein CTI12_AA261080 [Artemisia annua]